MEGALQDLLNAPTIFTFEKAESEDLGEDKPITVAEVTQEDHAHRQTSLLLVYFRVHFKIDN